MQFLGNNREDDDGKIFKISELGICYGRRRKLRDNNPLSETPHYAYFAINVLIDIVPWIQDVLERGSLVESAILIGMAGGTIIPAFFAVLFGFLWARKIIRGEDTSQL